MANTAKCVKTCCYLSPVLAVGIFSALGTGASPPQPPRQSITADKAGEAEYRRDVQPLLRKYCYPCHGNGAKSGNIALDVVQPAALPKDRLLFQKVLMNLRSGLMPPAGMDRPTDVEKDRIAQWIKTGVFGIDPAHPDPGRVTVRRLNRVEYRNTIRDLLGVDFDTQTEFPPDDSGHGFDDIGDVLTLSPMLMEKYINAAQAIVSQAVPTQSRVVAETEIPGASFVRTGAVLAVDKPATTSPYCTLSYYEPATVAHIVQIEHPGSYQLVLDLSANERYVDNVFDYNRCRLIVRSDGEELFRQEFNREGGKQLHYVFDRKWQAGGHALSFEVQPLTPDAKQIRSLTLRINKVTVRGPMDPKYRVEPRNYRTFFPKPVPASLPARHSYACAVLGNFARKAFRRPVDNKTVGRLAALAESIYTQPGQTFEAGISQAMVAVLASPQFLFREERPAATQTGQRYALIDEYSLASRLSYFLWSSMPDEELFRLATHGQLRKNLRAQVQRMLRDPRSEAFMQNFCGQWLQTRDIETVSINPFAVLFREVDPATIQPGQRRRFGNFPRIRFDETARRDMRREADLYFGHVVRDDRSVLELINSNYTFLNARLAEYYGLKDLGVTGDEFRMVTLPPNSPRGGMLTMGSVLAVTSNPTRTSPVKRGLFILDNILGAPPPPPPPNIPPLEAAAVGLANAHPTLREVLAVHRSKPECTSCHQRLDPPGLALENFNAIGMWRDKEFGQPIESGGTLVTGESFKNVQELKQILVSKHSTEFYRRLSEKLLTYALGRGLEDYDTESVDRIEKRLEQNQGRFSALLDGVIESAPFQQCRNETPGSSPARQPARLAQSRVLPGRVN